MFPKVHWMFLNSDLTVQYYYVCIILFCWVFDVLYIFWTSLIYVLCPGGNLKSVFHSVSLKFWACYITGQWGEFRVKNATSCLHILFWHFFVVFIKKFVFLSFSLLSNFRNRILTNQKLKLVIRNCKWNCMWKTVPHKRFPKQKLWSVRNVRFFTKYFEQARKSLGQIAKLMFIYKIWFTSTLF